MPSAVTSQSNLGKDVYTYQICTSLVNRQTIYICMLIHIYMLLYNVDNGDNSGTLGEFPSGTFPLGENPGSHIATTTGLKLSILIFKNQNQNSIIINIIIIYITS